MNIKDKSLLTYRTHTHRNVEDWREDPSSERQGPWAVHCLEHGQRKFFPSYSNAKAAASLAWPCPVCRSFDERCVHCPSDHAEWENNSSAGYTASAGHITGKPVCLHHQYGAIPEGIDYRESLDASLDKPAIEIFVGSITDGLKVISVSFNIEDQSFWLTSHDTSKRMSLDRAQGCHLALGFGLQVAVYLNERLKPACDDQRPYGFESWEAVVTRLGNR